MYCTETVCVFDVRDALSTDCSIRPHRLLQSEKEVEVPASQSGWRGNEKAHSLLTQLASPSRIFQLTVPKKERGKANCCSCNVDCGVAANLQYSFN